MNQISEPIVKTDHSSKMRGSAMYVCDYPTDGMLFGRILRSTIARGVVTVIDLPELPEGYLFVSKDDVPGDNMVHMIQDDTPVFTNDVEFIGEPVGMLFGPDEREVERLLDEIKVEYETLEAVFDARVSNDVFFEYNIEKGDVDSAFSEADNVFEEVFETGLQEQMYLETNGMIAEYSDGKMHIHGSMQCPYYVHNAVAQATGLLPENVIVKQDVTGGGFGGKEDYPSTLACQAAIAALKAEGTPVRVVFDRQEDTASTSKRHPSFCTYKVAVKDGKITAMHADILLDAGAYTTMSMVVLQRASIGGCGVYHIPNLKIHGHARKTNTAPSGAFRGFGGPQVFFAVEMMMSHVAKELGVDPADFKLAHATRQGELTSTSGRYHFPVPVQIMINDILRESDYYNKQQAYKQQSGRYRRGLGLSAVYHGAGFTGNGERDLIKAVVKLHKYSDGRVELLTSNTDMGQGLTTTFTKIVASELCIPINKVVAELPDTSRVPDSGPTVASRSVMVVGEMLRRAAAKLKSEWVDGEEQIITQNYEHPEFLIPFDLDTFKGDSYPTFSWAVTAVEVEIDTLTGYICIIDVWGSYDVGTPIDEQIITGQMEGGIVQSLGYAMMEKHVIQNGRLFNTKLCDYIIPTALDAANIKVMLHVEEYPEGPYGAKGAGEMSHVGGAPAVLEAIENSLGVKLNRIPFLPEDVMDVLRKDVI